MKADVTLLPRDLQIADGDDRVVVVFDVLRATTSMIAALGAGVREIRVFDNLDAARAAASAFGGEALLCGEHNCLRPPDFDLGNSPGQFSQTHAGKTLFMSTTNGTRAIVAAQRAGVVPIGAIVNATAVARTLHRLDRDFTLLCAGTEGAVSMEDLLGAGAVLDAVRKNSYVELISDVARIAVRLFHATKEQLRVALAQARGGQNIIRAGLDQDIDFAASLDATDVVGIAHADPLRVTRLD